MNSNLFASSPIDSPYDRQYLESASENTITDSNITRNMNGECTRTFGTLSIYARRYHCAWKRKTLCGVGVCHIETRLSVCSECDRIRPMRCVVFFHSFVCLENKPDTQCECLSCPCVAVCRSVRAVVCVTCATECDAPTCSLTRVDQKNNGTQSIIEYTNSGRVCNRMIRNRRWFRDSRWYVRRQSLVRLMATRVAWTFFRRNVCTHFYMGRMECKAINQMERNDDDDVQYIFASMLMMIISNVLWSLCEWLGCILRRLLWAISCLGCIWYVACLYDY